jgi:hypothetical protein
VVRKEHLDLSRHGVPDKPTSHPARAWCFEPKGPNEAPSPAHSAPQRQEFAAVRQHAASSPEPYRADRSKPL